MDPGLRAAVSFTQVYTVDLVQESGAWHANLRDLHAATAPTAPAPMSHAGMAMDMAGAAPPMAMTLKPGDTVKMIIVNHTETEHPVHCTVTSSSHRRATAGPTPARRSSAIPSPSGRTRLWWSPSRPTTRASGCLHCHILWHAGMGMGFMFNYDGIETPYRHGGPAGNKSE